MCSGGNLIHSKFLNWLIHKYNYFHRYLTLGGGNPDSNIHAGLQNKLKDVTDSFNTWLDNLSIFSSNSGVTITICKEQIKNVKIFDFLWTSANTDAQMKWTTDHLPAFFELLRKYAKD